MYVLILNKDNANESFFELCQGLKGGGGGGSSPGTPKISLWSLDSQSFCCLEPQYDFDAERGALKTLATEPGAQGPGFLGLGAMEP